MRDIEEQRIALECLKLAEGDLGLADAFIAFVTGEEQDDAKSKLNAVREVVSG